MSQVEVLQAQVRILTDRIRELENQPRVSFEFIDTLEELLAGSPSRLMAKPHPEVIVHIDLPGNYLMKCKLQFPYEITAK